MGSLLDKRVVVTGAARGLGRAYAMAIAAAGGRVVINDMDLGAARETTAEIIRLGGMAVVSGASVADPEGAESIIDLCVREYGGIDGLVNNAGLFYNSSPLDEEATRVQELMSVNVCGPIFCGHAAIRRMEGQGGGTIVNVVSGAALGIPGMSTYGASKGAMISLTVGWSKDLEACNIRVVGISPVARTRMSDAPGVKNVTRSEPEQIAPLVVYLLSDRAAYLNGQIIRLAGGDLSIIEPPAAAPVLASSEDWTVDSLHRSLSRRSTRLGERP